MAELDGAVLAMPAAAPPEEALQAKREDEQAISQPGATAKSPAQSMPAHP
jgi:hypothetical protein